MFIGIYLHELGKTEGEIVKEMVVDRCDLPDGFNVDDYVFFQGMPTRILNDHDMIDIVSREIEVYLSSLEKVSALTVKKAFANTFRQLKADGKLHHGSATYYLRFILLNGESPYAGVSS